MTRFRFYVNWTDRAGEYQTSGHLATGPAEAFVIQKHYLAKLERIESVDAKPDLVEEEGGACRILKEPEATEIEARFKTEAQAINDTIAAIRGIRAFNEALGILAAE